MQNEYRQNWLATGIFCVVVVLMAIGVVFVVSASANLGQDFDFSKFYKYTSWRQLCFFPAAVFAMLIASAVDYRRLSLEKGFMRSPVTWLLGASIILLLIVLVPGIGVEKNFARRWLELSLGPATLSFQPSELAKWSIVFFLAALCSKFKDELNLFTKRFIPICAVVGIVAGLIIIEDFGTAALICLIAFLMLIAAGASLWYILTPIPLGIVGLVAAILSSEARKDRITAFLHPDQWTDGINYQPSQSLIALGSGGLFGKGLGRGICKYGHLPEDTTDFIFAIICEELGFVGAAAIICLFVLFVLFSIFVVKRCRDDFGRLLASGIVFVIAIQAALNLGVVTVVLPTKGIPLPFVSAGGSSLLLSAAAVGVLINIAKNAEQTEVLSV